MAYLASLWPQVADKIAAHVPNGLSDLAHKLQN
jgi:hypothetical protein